MRKFLKIAVCTSASLLFLSLLALGAFVGHFVWHYEAGMGLPTQAELRVIAAQRSFCSPENAQHFTRLTDIPMMVQQAVLAATHDPDFLNRSPINPYTAILMSLIFGTRPHSSLVSQGVARCFIDSSKKCCSNQFDWHMAQFVMVRRVESDLPKDTILEIYLNELWLGRAQGVSAAANAYFGKGLADLSLDEAAFIAGLSRNPSAFRNTDRSIQLRNRVLNALLDREIISPAQAKAAEDAPLRLREASPPA